MVNQISVHVDQIKHNHNVILASFQNQATKDETETLMDEVKKTSHRVHNGLKSKKRGREREGENERERGEERERGGREGERKGERERGGREGEGERERVNRFSPVSQN